MVKFRDLMWQELRHGVRRLRRNPLVSIPVALTLAVGVGAVTTAFTLVRGALSPLDYPRSGELVRVYETVDDLKSSPNPRLAAIWNQLPVSYANTADWRRNGHLRGAGLFLGYTAVLEAGREPQEVSAAKVDAELFRVLGVAPGLGRLFDPAEVRENRVILGHDLWAGVFGGDESLLGRTIRLDGQAFTVVGVMPPGFSLPGRKDGLWTPLAPGENDQSRDYHTYSAIGRLSPGARLEAAQAEMDRLAAGLRAAYPDTNEGTGARLVPLLDTVIGDSRRILGLLSAAAAAVLLVACVNVAHLLLALRVERRDETALRLALGARRLHLLRQSGIETLLLAVAGSLGGLLLAELTRRALPMFLAAELPRLEEIRIDGSGVLFALGAGLAATLLAGVLPAVFASGTALRKAMAERRVVRLAMDGLVVLEVALTLVLTAGALTLAASWMRLAAVDPGFDAENVLVQEIRLPAWQYPDEVRRNDFAARAVASLEALPETEGVALTSRLPLPGPAEIWGFQIPGRDAPEANWIQGRSAVMQFVTPEYFRVLRIPLIEGRAFDPRPGPESGRVLMVNRSLAEKHWPGGKPLGTEVVMQEQAYRIEGIFADIRHQGLAEETGDLMVQPWNQRSPAAFMVLVRFRGRPLSHASAVRAALRRLDPALPLPPAALLSDQVAGSVLGPRSRALLVGLSAGVALLLALIGTYSVMAYGISRRRREIAIRMATGADRRSVQWWVLRRALALALAGVGLGIFGALAARRLLSGLLYGVEAAGAGNLLAAVALLLAAGLAAGYLPARRASRIDPAPALRND